MSFGDIIKSIFKGGDASQASPASDPVEYEGFSIEAAPMAENGQFRTAGYISGELDGEIKRIPFIRADLNADQQTAIDHSISKARQIIDEQGASLLERAHL